MRYFDYFIKCIIRNFVRLFIKPICIIIVVFLAFVLFMFADSVFASESLAVESVNFQNWDNKAFQSNSQTGGDGGTAVVVSYTGLHGRAIYFKPNIKGIVNLNFTSNEMHYAYYIGEYPPSIGDEVERYYHTVYENTGLYAFDTTVGSYNQTGYWFVYYSVDLTSQNPTYDTLEDYSNEGVINSQQQTTNAINQQTNVIQQQTTAINQQTNSINNINNTILNNNIDNNSMNIDVSSLEFEDEQGIDTFFTNLINTIKSAYDSIDSSVETIEIPLPYTEQKLVLTSDLLSKHIVNTSLYNLIQIFWYFLIGSYIVIFCRRIIVWLTSGEIAERGPASFIRYLDKNNELIKTYMM